MVTLSWNETALFRTDKGNSFMGEYAGEVQLVGVEEASGWQTK